ncbi:MAG: histidine phosphotransferase family protein [Pseudomonadota bacterium]
MAEFLELSPAELGALLCSRVCHDVISPVGAINNGLELLAESEGDEGAMDLITTSAANASSRLQFCRIAFGASGSAGADIDTGDAQQVTEAYMASEKPELTWNGTRAFLPKNKVKLFLNLILIANASIPRGGTLDATIVDEAGETHFTLKSSGRLMRVPQKFQDFMDGRFGEEGVDAHNVQFYYTLLLAREVGMKIDIAASDEAIVYTAG